MKILSALFLPILISTTAFGQLKKGDKFPDFEAQTLNEAELKLPADAQNKTTVYLIAWTAEAQKGSNIWAKEFYANFLDPNGMEAALFDCNVYIVYMYGGAKKTALGKAGKKIKGETDADLYDNIVLSAVPAKLFKDELQFKDKDQPNIFVVDKRGVVGFHTYGRYTSEKMDQVLEAVGDL